MIVFGIDQGLAHLGYSVVDFKFIKKTSAEGYVKIYPMVWAKLIEYDAIFTTSDEEFPERLFRLTTKLENKILEYNPDMVCCERLFYSPPGKGSRNKSSAIMTTNMVTGTIAYICGKHRIKFNTYPPTRVKKNLCGSGTAQKEDVIKKILELFEINTTSTKKEHICDSVAIAMSFIFTLLANEDELDKYLDDEKCILESDEYFAITPEAEDNSEEKLTELKNLILKELAKGDKKKIIEDRAKKKVTLKAKLKDINDEIEAEKPLKK